MNQQDFQPATGLPVHQNSGTRSHNELSPLADLIEKERSCVKAVPCADRVVLKFPGAVGLAMTVPGSGADLCPSGRRGTMKPLNGSTYEL
jgi:hypothetical protein